MDGRLGTSGFNLDPRRDNGDVKGAFVDTMLGFDSTWGGVRPRNGYRPHAA